MRIDGLTVCVDYAAELKLSLDRWAAALDSVMVVSAPRDRATREACRAAGRRVSAYFTTAFYEDQAAFNKGRALQEGLSLVRPREWVLLFDADIVPPVDLRERIEAAGIRPGTLYGCPRHQAPDPEAWDSPPDRWPSMNDREVAGYFMLFHAADPAVGDIHALIPSRYTHAGNYDSELQNRWGLGAGMDRKAWLDIPLLHVGQPGANWCGVGNERAVADLRRQRRAGRHWTQETIST